MMQLLMDINRSLLFNCPVNGAIRVIVNIQMVLDYGIV